MRFTRGLTGLSGKWIMKLQCPGTAVLVDTANLSATATSWDVQVAIWNACPVYYYKVFVTRVDKFNTNPASTFGGYSYTISYDDYRVNIPELQATGATSSDTVKTLSFGGD